LADIELLAVDVDGTLTASGNEISPATRAALHRLRGAGVEVAIATGRRYRNVSQVIDHLGLPAPSVCLGGALVKTSDGHTLHAQGFEPPEFQTVAALFRERGHAVVAQRDAHHEGGPDFVVDGSIVWNPPTRDYFERNQGFAESAPWLSDQARDDVLVIGTFGEGAVLQELERELQRLHPGSFTVHVMPGFVHEGYYWTSATTSR
jgi:hydroxymethylpyrimidine pyrophosphatase-like HAD family hydrolase